MIGVTTGYRIRVAKSGRVKFHGVVIVGATPPRACAARTPRAFCRSSRDRVVTRIVSLAPDHFGQYSASCVNKPITDLQHAQVGRSRQMLLLALRGVRVESVLPKPQSQDVHGVFGKVSSTLFRRRPATFRVTT
jgi:hypothetical protein